MYILHAIWENALVQVDFYYVITRPTNDEHKLKLLLNFRDEIKLSVSIY